MGMRAYSYNRQLKQAGGVDLLPGEDPATLLRGFPLQGMESQDIVLATYIYDALASSIPSLDDFRNKLAEEYAVRYAGWIGYALTNRANRTTKDKPMKELEEAIEEWVEDIPNMLTGSDKPLSKSLSASTAKYLDLAKIDKIGDRILREVHKEWKKDGEGTRNASADLRDMDISFDPVRRLYVIPKVSEPGLEGKLRDLGFKFEGDSWTTRILEPLALKMFPAIKLLPSAPQPKSKPAPSRGIVPEGKPHTEAHNWFFYRWLPSNLHRFSKIFTDFGRVEGVEFVFKFTLQGDDIAVHFEKDVGSDDTAADVIFDRYKKQKDRAETWLQAIEVRKDLLQAKGRNGIKVVDRANDLMHNHGAMMEHMPPDIRRWYPEFLDFKFTGSIIGQIRRIGDQDLREITLAINETLDPEARRRPSPESSMDWRDLRTVRGLAMEVLSQNSKAGKKKRLRQMQETYPKLYHDVVKYLEKEGFRLT